MGLTNRHRIDVLLEEYRAMYRLLLHRIQAMDRRFPLAGGTLAGLLGATTAMPDDTKMAFLYGLPPALFWLVSTTVSHARSKEDHLRRIEEIERQVNELAGEELLVFQSRHPNRKKSVAGRSGSTAVLAVTTTAITLIGACVFLVDQAGLLERRALVAYVLFSALCAMGAAASAIRLRLYRYDRPAAPPNAPCKTRD